MTWQREAVERAVDYMQNLVAAGAEDQETHDVLNGLREVLDPALRRARIQRVRELDQMDAEGIKPSGRDVFEEKK